MIVNDSWYEKGGSRGYVTTRPRLWESGWKGSGHLITVPEGFEFESSVPRLLKWVISPDDPYFLWAACLHDYLIEVVKARRPFCDSQWLEAARSDKAPALKREFAYIGMRVRMLVKKI